MHSRVIGSLSCQSRSFHFVLQLCSPSTFPFRTAIPPAQFYLYSPFIAEPSPRPTHRFAKQDKNSLPPIASVDLQR